MVSITRLEHRFLELSGTSQTSYLYALKVIFVLALGLDKRELQDEFHVIH